MRARAISIVVAAVAAALAVTAGSRAAGDPEAADRQYRVARRLAAQGAPEAAAALERVVELDPKGTQADDAIVEQALLLSPAVWPEDLGRLDERLRDRIVALLDRAVEGYPGGDRIPEARHLRALARLEPLARSDPAAAYVDLVSVTAAPAAGRWAIASRYALGWLEERDGRIARARASYGRMVADGASGTDAGRAFVGLARCSLRSGDPGRAAARLQDAIEASAPDRLAAEPLRELAVAAVLRRSGSAGRWRPTEARAVANGLRGAASFLRTREGGVVVADRKASSVVFLDAAGRPAGSVPLEQPTAVGVDPFGRVLVASGENVWRLDPDGPRAVALLGGWTAARSLAADAIGRIWLLDRRGKRIGVVERGAGGPTLLRESDGADFAALAWAGGRLVVVEEDGGRLIVVDADGAAVPLASPGLRRAASLSIDPAGQIAVLDAKSGVVVLLGPDGAERDRLDTEAIGASRPAAVALGWDGSIDVLDEDDGSIRRLP